MLWFGNILQGNTESYHSFENYFVAYAIPQQIEDQVNISYQQTSPTASFIMTMYSAILYKYRDGFKSFKMTVLIWPPNSLDFNLI